MWLGRVSNDLWTFIKQPRKGVRMGRLTSKLDEPVELVASTKQPWFRVDAGLIVIGLLVVATVYVLAH